MNRNCFERMIAPVGFCHYDDSIWFLQFNISVLVKLNLKSMGIEDAYRIPNKPLIRVGAYTDKVIEHEGVLYIFLNDSERIFRFSIIESRFIEPISFPVGFKIRGNAIVKYSDLILIMPYGGDNIIILNLSNNTINSIPVELTDLYIKNNCCCYKDGIYFVDMRKNQIYILNMNTLTMDTRPFKMGEGIHFGICENEGRFFIPDDSKEEICIINDKNETSYIKGFPNGYKYLSGASFISMHKMNGYIYLFPQDSNMILKIDCEKNSIGSITSLDEFGICIDAQKNKFISQIYNDVIRIGDMFYSYYYMGQCWHIIDPTTDTIERAELKIDSEEVMDMLCRLFDVEEREEIILKEGPGVYNLPFFIKSLIHVHTCINN